MVRKIYILALLLISSLFKSTVQFDHLASDVEKWANLLGEHLREMFKEATKDDEIISMYRNYGEVEIFDPRIELKKAKSSIETYLKRRAKSAWDAKLSLESRVSPNVSDDDVNNPLSAQFIRFMSAKAESDVAYVHAHDHTGHVSKVNSTRNFNLTTNANFYGIPTSSISSAVHIPTPVYDRNPEVLKKIKWSDIDHLYRANRDETRDLAFQMFCSESGFMRYYPSVSWIWDNRIDRLDLFDCRSTEWYINAATLSKNVIVMLDMSGSMLGQRFEIAKQTVEAILETLSDNDFFNILTFSKTVSFLDECSEKAGLLQATVRNKKMLRARLNGMSSEGKAEYEKGLIKAFETLLKLPESVNFTTTDELALRREQGDLPKDVHYISIQDHILVVPNHLYQAMRNYTGKKAQFGCNDVIMLITDGAPNYFKQIFQLYNKNKSVRFFSFLIGEEATDVEQVKWMACDNKGFMVHISNLADVQEKVQHYIRVMSRPVGKHATSFGSKDAIWSGVYKERLQELLVTTVSYPVMQDGELLGVTAINVPVIELAQLAHTVNFGSRSYTFMLDNNDYMMFHPQMRLLDQETRQMKLNYNNIDILELEVSQNQKLAQTLRVNCDNIDAPNIEILFATEDLHRIYRQTNTYYFECLKDSPFTVGVAVAKGDEKRVKPGKSTTYGDVKLLWFDTPNWIMHPQWRYCLLNDSDSNLTPEAAFTTYIRQMREERRFPRLCESRKALVDRFIFDMEVTNGLTNLWDVNWKSNKKKQLHMVFFATSSGMIKYWDELPNNLVYSVPAQMNHSYSQSKIATISTQQQNYQHFIKDLNSRSSEDQYYIRSVRMKNKIVVDVNTKTHLWHNKESLSAYGHPENISILMTATKALHIDGAVIGVAGLEFTLDYMANVLAKLGCGPQDERQWCFLLDEHAYIVYSSLNTTRYSSLFSNDEIEKAGNPIGRWFGSLNAITERTMTLLIKNHLYTETTYIDYQAVCRQHEIVMFTAGAFKLHIPFFHIFQWILSRIWFLLRHFTIFQTFISLLNPVTAYTATFTGDVDTYACDKISNFYLANWGEDGWMGQRMPTSAALISDNFAERPCKHNPAKCAVKMYASWVPGTNLLLVVISQNQSPSSVCYDPLQCPLSSAPQFRTTFTQVEIALDKQMLNMEQSDPFSDDIHDRKCRHVRSKRRRSPSKCIRSDQDESAYPCSLTRHSESFSLALLISVIMFSCNCF